MLGEKSQIKKVGKKIKKSVDISGAVWYSNKAPRENGVKRMCPEPLGESGYSDL